MICSSCGKNNPDDARFCDGCGNTLGSAAPQQTYSSAPPPPPQPQPQYQQPPVNNSYQQPQSYAANVDNSPLGTGQFLGMMFLMLIPVVGFILLLVWAFGDANANRKSFARAYLIFYLIMIGIAIVLTIATGGLLMSLLGSY